MAPVKGYPEIGEEFVITERTLGLQPGTVLTVVGYHGGRISFRTRAGATAIKTTDESGRIDYFPITFSPTEMKGVMEPHDEHTREE